MVLCYSSNRIMSPLLEELHSIGFLTHDLVSVSPEKTVNMHKYMGVCILPAGENERDRRHRRALSPTILNLMLFVLIFKTLLSFPLLSPDRKIVTNGFYEVARNLKAICI